MVLYGELFHKTRWYIPTWLCMTSRGYEKKYQHWYLSFILVSRVVWWLGEGLPYPPLTFLSSPSHRRATQHDNLPRKLFSSGIKPPEFSQTSQQLIWCNFWDPLKFWRKDDYVGISLHVSVNSFLLNVNCVPLLRAAGSLLYFKLVVLK